MAISIYFLILRRMGTLNGAMLDSAVIYKKEHLYKGTQPGRVTTYLKERIGSTNDYLIDVIVDGDRIQSLSAAEWLKFKWADEWNRIKRGEIPLKDRKYQ